MSIEIIDDPIERRPDKDIKRHQDKVLDAIKKNIPEIIGNEDIITARRGKKIRIRVKGLRSFRFIFDRGQGVGSGDGDEDAGDEPGEESFDTEMELERLIEMALQECGLPNLQKKEETVSEVFEGWEVKKIRKSGTWSNLHKRRSVIEAKLRKEAYVRTLMRLTGLGREECEQAYYEAHGDFKKAYTKLLERLAQSVGDGDIEEAEKGVEREIADMRKLFFREEDLRFRELRPKLEEQSNAAIYAIRDASGSMDGEKKFLSRMMLFWLVEALRILYKNVIIKFILHTTEAEFCSEQDFFQRSESGGTMAVSGYAMAHKDIDTNFPTDRWNVYVFHFSDGDDFAEKDAVSMVLKIMELGINMFGYGEINTVFPSDLMKEFMDKIPHVMQNEGDLRIITSNSPDQPFLGATFNDKKDLFPILKEFLKKERKEWTR